VANHQGLSYYINNIIIYGGAYYYYHNTHRYIFVCVCVYVLYIYFLYAVDPANHVSRMTMTVKLWEMQTALHIIRLQDAGQSNAFDNGVHVSITSWIITTAAVVKILNRVLNWPYPLNIHKGCFRQLKINLIIFLWILSFKNISNIF